MKSIHKNQFLSVINAIWSPALHSGWKGEDLRIHIALTTSLAISIINSNPSNNFGNLRGGGRFGNSISGKLGISGSSGTLNSGKVGISGRFIFTPGTFGKFKFGRFGKIIRL